ncbi:hypothetical protein K438DRAFT_11991 [Mycena galopus ATCC 62051]|nr:hypothetical protein K438DRAFT_11991 [Mycena galopus ATCC 62051]
MTSDLDTYSGWFSEPCCGTRPHVPLIPWRSPLQLSQPIQMYSDRGSDMYSRVAQIPSRFLPPGYTNYLNPDPRCPRLALGTRWCAPARHTDIYHTPPHIRFSRRWLCFISQDVMPVEFIGQRTGRPLEPKIHQTARTKHGRRRDRTWEMMSWNTPISKPLTSSLWAKLESVCNLKKPRSNRQPGELVEGHSLHHYFVEYPSYIHLALEMKGAEFWPNGSKPDEIGFKSTSIHQ